MQESEAASGFSNVNIEGDVTGEKGEFTSRNKKSPRIATTTWKPAAFDQPRAIVLIVHGVGEHCGYYEPIAKLLIKHDVLVCAHDHVGHGLSEGTRVDIQSFSEYVEDVIQHCEIVQKDHPNCPIFLIGHSMGGTICLKAALDYPDLFKGIVLIGPAIVPNPATSTPFKVFMANMLAKVVPQFPVGPVESKWVCRDPQIQQQYDSDPLVYHGSLKARWASCMLSTLSEVRARLAEIKLPFLVLHGEEDKLCEISGSKLLHEKASSEDKSIKIYPGAYHQVHYETEGVAEQSKAEMVNWIVNRI